MIAGLSALELFGAFGTAVTIFGGGIQLGRKFGARDSDKRLKDATLNLDKEREKTENLDRRLKQVRSILNDESDVWLRWHPDLGKHLKEIRSSIPIVTVCNFKGGVGKTTLTSLLAGYFDLEKKKRVLLIDFDYQGSLTDALLASADLQEADATSRRLIQRADSPEHVLPHAIRLSQAFPRTRLFTSFYGFHRIENAVMLNWIADKDEVRLRTHQILSSPIVQNEFDLIIIDAPPRLSTATVNAFCASTHVLIPTILDNISVQAALNTVKVLYDFREHLNPGLEVLGIVPTLVAQVRMNQREIDGLERLDARLPEYWRKPTLPHVFRDCPIYRREAIATTSGVGIAYESSDEVRRMVNTLGDSIARRLFNDAREVLSSDPEASGTITPIHVGRRRA